MLPSEIFCFEIFVNIRVTNFDWLLQIQSVLDAVGLSQYKEAFAREAIDGELFTCLDDETLEEELQVSSKIHRIRILNMIGEDTYVTMK